MTVSKEVREHIRHYFKVNLPNYTVLEIRQKSTHPDDGFLYMVSAGKDDSTYAVWTCWNESTQSLNFGHYGLSSIAECEKIFEQFYYKG